MTATGILTAILGVIKAIPIVDGWFLQLVALYVSSQNKETQLKFIDAASFCYHAETDDQRYEGSKKWMQAVKRDRISV